MKKYLDIVRVKPEYLPAFQLGDNIQITEKVDGANFSIKYDDETDSVIGFSRTNLLSPSLTLRGAYAYVDSLDKELYKRVLGNDLIIFCEWLVKHTIHYPESYQLHPYAYDVFDSKTGNYLFQKDSKRIASQLGISYVPIFYEGPFISWNHVNSFVGKTELEAAPSGEGIVIKNQSTLVISRRSEGGHALPFYLKIVGESMKEVRSSNREHKNTPQPIKESQDYEKALCIVTLPRVNKKVNELIDNGIIPSSWDEKNLSIIAKNVPRMVYEDCLKEEGEIVKTIENFGKCCNKITMELVKEELRKRQDISNAI